MIGNDNTYAKSCILYCLYKCYTVKIHIGLCVCVRAFVRVRAHVRAYVKTCVGLCVCACVRFGAYKWSIQMRTLVFVLAVVEFSAKVHPFRIC